MATSKTKKSERVVCAGCRQQGPRVDFERFVHHDDIGLVYDMRGGAPGEEVFVHPLAGCMSAAAWGGFARTLEQPVESVEADELIDEMREGIRRRLRERIQEAVRLESPVFGVNTVDTAVHEESVELVVLARDADSRRVEKFRDRCEQRGIPVFDALDGEELGQVFDQEVVVAVGLPPGSRCQAIGRDLEKLLCIEHDSDA